MLLRRLPQPPRAASSPDSGLRIAGRFRTHGGSIAFRLRADEIFHLALINPIQVYKMAAISGFDSSFDFLGPAGLYALRTYGNMLMPMLLGELVAWSIVPLVLAGVLLSRRPVS